MTKKEFKERSDYHRYTGRPRENNINALFFDWQSNDEGRGFKYCVYARACNATKAELETALHNFLKDNTYDPEWYIQLIVAWTDKQRFKVPISGSGLRSLIKN